MSILYLLLLIIGSVLEVGLIFGFFWFFFKWLFEMLYDRSIIFDKGDRWTIITQKLKNKDGFNYKGGFYKLDHEAVKKSEGGKILSMHWYNRPEPLRILQNKNEWLSSETVVEMLNNDIAKDIVTPKNPLKDVLILISAMCSGIGLCVLILIAFKVFGIIKGKGGV